MEVKEENGENASMQPWQIFSCLFLVFWVSSALMDHFLLTLVFCIAFGVAAELLTNFMYGEKLAAASISKQKEELRMLIEMSNSQEGKELDGDENEDTSSPLIINKDSLKMDELIQEEEIFDDEEEEDDEPPPLPDKDYGKGDICSNNEGTPFTSQKTIVPDEIVELLESSHIDKQVNYDIATNQILEASQIDTQVTYDDLTNQIIENIDQKIKVPSEILEPKGANIANMKEDDVIDKIVLNSDENPDNHTQSEVEQTSYNDGVDKLTSLEAKHPELLTLKCNQASIEDESDYEGDININQFYANDSSDENDEYSDKESPEREENSEDCYSEEEEFAKKTNEFKIKDSIEDIEFDSNKNNLTDNLLLESQRETITNAGNKLETEKLKVDNTNEVSDELKDIDLSDPALEAAANKIQSAFKGFKTKRQQSGAEAAKS